MNNVNENGINRHNDKCDGRSMIEMLGVLAIIGVLSVGGIAGYSKAMHRYRVNKTIDQITYMAGAIRTFFAPQKSYKGLCSSIACWNPQTNGYDINGTLLLKKAKLIPDEMWESCGNGTNTYDCLKSIWGEDLIIGFDESDDGKTFYLYYLDTPTEYCIDIVTQDWSSLDAYLVDVQGDFKSAPPISLADAIDVCDTEWGAADVVLYFK